MIDPRWILNRSAVAAHRRYLAEHGGAPGVCFYRLFIALGWPKSVLAFAGGSSSIFELAAAYAEGVLKTRPFASGNVSMAYLYTMMFLAINRAHLPADSLEKVAMFRTFELGVLDRTAHARWMLLRSVTPEGATAIAVRRDRRGRIVRLSLLKPGRHSAAGRRRLPDRVADAEPVEMFLN